MRTRSLGLLVAATLTLAACQMFSGLGQLELRDAGPEPVGTAAESDPERSQQDASAGNDETLAKCGMVAHNATSRADRPDASDNIASSAAPDAGAQDAGVSNTSPFGRLPTPSNGGSRAPSHAARSGTDAGAAGASGAAAAADAGSAAMLPACVPPPAGGPACTAAPQCGCDKTQNCAVLSDKLTCVTAGGGGENQPCSTVADCMIGYECVAGACAKLCDTAHPACSAGAKCIQLASSAGALIAGAYFCESNCNLVDPQRADGELSACGPGLVCGWSGTGTRCAQSEHALHRHGEACSTALDCAPGYTCASDSGTCTKWCVSTSDCPSDFGCNTSGAVSVGQKSFGTCKPNCLERTEQVCGLTTQCGCDAAHSCSALARSIGRISHVCREVGPVRSWGSCTYQEDCARDTTCVDGGCRPHCLTEFECERYALCDFSYYDQAPLIPAVSTCTRACDPADPHRAGEPRRGPDAGQQRRRLPAPDGTAARRSPDGPARVP